MNYLGHFYLSQNDPELVVGNFIGDFVKGKKYRDYPDKISEGIMMHRHIDYFTDQHPIVGKGRKRLFDTYRHYSGVIMDMYYDHFLANLWQDYSKESLSLFSQRMYEIIDEYWDHLPEKSRHMFPYMKSGDWLQKYSTVTGIGNSLTGMSKRLNNGSGLEHSVDQLQEFYDEFQSEFQEFIVDIKNNFD